MQIVPALLPSLIRAIADTIEKNAEEVTKLDQAIGDGDHVTNLQHRGFSSGLLQAHLLHEWSASYLQGCVPLSDRCVSYSSFPACLNMTKNAIKPRNWNIWLIR